jgi:methylmalonyl-CoA mutase N-terminal domain/subunit
MEVESKRRIIVGLNKYQVKEQPPKGLLKVDPEVGKLQEEKLKDIKASRDNLLVSETLKTLERKAGKNDNLIPEILNCVKSYCTLGEISDTLRNVFGEYKASISI